MSKFLKIIIVLILVFLAGLTYYKVNHNNNDIIIENLYYIGDKKNNETGIDYINEYADNIINESITEIEYFVSIDNDAIYGKIFINENKELFIYDEVNNKMKKLISEKKFKTLNNISSIDGNGLFLTALSEDGSLYYISLFDTDINEIDVSENKLGYKFTKFTNLMFKSYLGFEESGRFILTDTGKIVDYILGFEYNPKNIYIDNQYVLFEDNTIAVDSDKYIMKDENNLAKIKDIIYVEESNKLFEHSPNIILITEENRIIYSISDDEIYDYGKYVKSISIDNGKYKIVFDDNSHIEFSGQGMNDYAEVKK